jgi:hypothetical protein
VSSAYTATALRPDVTSYPLDGELILFDGRRGRLFALNSTASFIWSSLASGVSVDETAEQLQQATGVPKRQAVLDITSLLAHWRGAGLLLEQPGATPPEVSDEAGVRDLPARAFPRRSHGRAPLRGARLMDRGVRLLVDDSEAAAAIEAVFGRHLVPATETGDDWPTLAVLEEGARWTLWLDDLRLAECSDASELVPMIYANTAQIIYEATDCFAAVHAAAVAKGDACVLMPAVSASGKSTLTAALIASGYDYCTDDLALLTAAPTRLRPVPMQIGLKSGSWAVLSALCPELASQPTYRRPDKQLVRYLHPRGAARSSDERLQVAAIVFPSFKREAATRLRRIGRAEGLARLAEAGYDLTGKLDKGSVESLIEWLETLECYELQFSNLTEAVDAFAPLLP